MKNIHVLPTDKPSRLFIAEKDIDMFILSDKFELGNKLCENQNIYITSDEEIKDCWVLNIYTNEVYFVKGFYGIQPIIKKIILTTDQDLIKDSVQAINDESLEWFVKNPSCEFVEVVKKQCETLAVCDCKTIEGDYKIIIPKEEHKQETLEEVAFRKRKELGLKGTIEGFMAGFKACEEQNKNMYNEEDVLNLFKKYQNSFPLHRNIQILDREFNEWFEQFKKK